MAAREYRHEDVATAPRGWRVRTIAQGAHMVRMAFPPGPRKKGAGKLVSILHPLRENPAVCVASWKKASNEISDRAHRYRAQQCIPPGSRRCVACGSTRFLVVDHKDGDEWNDAPSNLRWLCKSCNTRLGAEMARKGKGRRTRQYNQGAKSLGAYVAAAIKHKRGAHDAGGKIIHETPKAKRSEYAKKIWAARRRFNPIYLGNPDTVRISGIEYEVLDRTTVQEHEEEGRPHLAAEMRTHKIAAGLTLARPDGDQTFQVYEYENGSFGRPFAMTGVSAKEWRRGNQKPSITAIYHPDDRRYGVYESVPGDIYHRFLGEYEKRAHHGLAKFGRGVGPQTIALRSVGLWTDLRGKGLPRARGNPLLESILAGAAAGTAVVGAQEGIKLLRERKGKGVWPFKRRSNQDNGTAALKLYESFHGRSPSEVLQMSEAIMESGTYVALGDNPELWLRQVPGRDPEKWPEPDISLVATDRVKVATDAEGKQLYFVGVNQKLPKEFLSYLSKQGADIEKRFIDVGEVFALSYETEKKFDGFKTISYAHRFGEDNGKRPKLVYDQRTEKMLLVGGAYGIAPYDYGLGASPGIVN